MRDLVMDGKLDDPEWEEVGFTDTFVDIATSITPQFHTRAKIRWSDDYLYIGALVQDPAVWANITRTCHCFNNSEDQVIFHDNDFEVFVDPGQTTHYYKEYEMNAADATWDLCLNKPYNDGGYENSTRVFGTAGFDMQPPMHAATFVYGKINDPSVPAQGWTAEIALPLSKLAINQSVTVPPPNGTFWRINFSRVEYNVSVVNGTYWKTPSCQSCLPVGSPCEDNWVWSPQGSVAMHLPERWGFLQFSTGTPNTTAQAYPVEWPVRAVASAVYYAQHSYWGVYNAWAPNASALLPFVEDPAIIDGTCTGGTPPSFDLWGPANARFNASIPPNPSGSASLGAGVTDDRYMTVFTWP